VASLEAQVRDLQHTHEALHVFLDRYARLAVGARVGEG